MLHDAGSLPDLSEELSGVDAKIVEQYALLGTHDFLTVVDVPVPLDAFKVSIADRGAEVTRVPPTAVLASPGSSVSEARVIRLSLIHR